MKQKWFGVGPPRFWEGALVVLSCLGLLWVAWVCLELTRHQVTRPGAGFAISQEVNDRTGPRAASSAARPARSVVFPPTAGPRESQATGVTDSPIRPVARAVQQPALPGTVALHERLTALP